MRQGSKRPFVAYFGGAGTGGRQHAHAWMSRSTHGLRERLRSVPHGLVFSTPLAPEAEPAAVKDERIQAELREIGHVSFLYCLSPMMSFSRCPTVTARCKDKMC